MNEVRHRIILSIVIVLSFLLTIHGITVAMSNNMDLHDGWKELLLLLLGAMIGNFGKVVDYWFHAKKE
jgi:hypothetical protein